MEHSIWQYLNHGWDLWEIWTSCHNVYRTWFAVTCMLGMVFVVVRQTQARPGRRVLMWLSTTLAALLFGTVIPPGIWAYIIADKIATDSLSFSPPLYMVIIPVVLNAFVVSLICVWALRPWGVLFTSRIYWWLVLLNACATGFGLGMAIVDAIRHPPTT